MLKDDVLYLLIKNKGQMLSGGAIADRLQVSRTAVWKAVNTLKAEGLEIVSEPNCGYVLEQSNKLLSRLITDNLAVESMFCDINIVESVDSTNNALKRESLQSLPQGYVLIANEQTGGRGRKERAFYSPKNGGLYMSILLKPNVPLEDIPFLTVCAALAVYISCKSFADEGSLSIKWVNDIFYNRRKLCGILTEGVFSAEDGTIDGVVLGIGINTGAVAPEVADIAASLAESGKPVDRNLLSAAVLNNVEKIYKLFLQGERQTIADEYAKKLFVINREVTVVLPDRTFRASVNGVNGRGELLLTDASGEKITLKSGEIIL